MKCNESPAKIIRVYPINYSGNEYTATEIKTAPIRLGTKRNTFSEYDCAVAKSTATLASTTSMDGPRRRRWDFEFELAMRKNSLRRKRLYYLKLNV